VAQATEIYPHIQAVQVRKTLTLDGAAGTGAQGAVPLFTVTGRVEVLTLVPYCSTNGAGASATIALGVTGSTSLFLGTTTVTDIDAGKFWLDTSPAEVGGFAIPAALKNIAILANIIATVATADATGGVIEFNLWYRPLSDGAMVVAA
jgi:hypothetical protein